MDAPSLAIIWAGRRGLGSGLICLLTVGAAAAVLIGAVRARGSLLARVAWIAALPLALNLGGTPCSTGPAPSSPSGEQSATCSSGWDRASE